MTAPMPDRWPARSSVKTGSVPVTVVVLTQDEEVNISRCLASVAWAAQVIVVDSGSSDSTVHLARAAGADVVETHWRGYGAQREFALRLDEVRYDWVMFVDADEWVSTPLAAEIDGAVRASSAAAHSMQFRLVFQGRWIRHCGWYPSARIVRLLRKSRAHFPADMFSEHPVVDGPIETFVNDLVDEDRRGLSSWLRKHVRYAELEAARRAARPRLAKRRANQSRTNYLLKDKVAPKVPARPLVQFLYMYVLRRGFLDGRAGLAFCFYHAWFQTVVADLIAEIASKSVSESAPPPRVAFLIGQFPPAYRGGGPVRSVLAMIKSSRHSAESLVLCSHRDWGSSVPLDVPRDCWVPRDGVKVYYAGDHRFDLYFKGLRAVRQARPDLVYVNGVFDRKHSIVPLVLARFGFFRDAAVVLCPRGELDLGALDGSILKTAILRLLRGLGFYRSVIGHATNPDEASATRSWLAPKSVVHRPPETELPSVPLNETPAHPNRLLFYSRIDRKKGLHVLLDSLRLVDAAVELDVIGEAADQEYLAACKFKADSLPSQHSVRFLGGVPPMQTRATLSQYGALFLPTAGENFGHVVAESLSVSRPVYLPPTTPWSDVAARLGTLVPGTSPELWAQAVANFISRDRSRLEESWAAAGGEYEAWHAAQKEATTLELLIQEVNEVASPRTSMTRERQ